MLGSSVPSSFTNALTPSFNPISASGTGSLPVEKMIGKKRCVITNSSVVSGNAWVSAI